MVFLWDVVAGTTVRRISGHMGKVFAVEFNEYASVFASGMTIHRHVGDSESAWSVVLYGIY